MVNIEHFFALILPRKVLYIYKSNALQIGLLISGSECMGDKTLNGQKMFLDGM